MTKELIEELRGEADKLEGYVSATTMSGSVWVTHTGMAIRAMRRVADALSARQPTEDEREAVTALNQALTNDGPPAVREKALQDAAVLARRALLSTAAVPDAATEFTSEGSGLFGVLGYSDDDLEVIKARAEAERDAALAALGRVQALTEAWRYGMPEYTSSTYQEGQKDQQRKLVGQLLAALDGAPEPEMSKDADVLVQVRRYLERFNPGGTHGQDAMAQALENILEGTQVAWAPSDDDLLPVEGEKP